MVVLRPNPIRDYTPETFPYRIVARKGNKFGGTWAFFRFLTDAQDYLERSDRSRWSAGAIVEVLDRDGVAHGRIVGEG